MPSGIASTGTITYALAAVALAGLLSGCVHSDRSQLATAVTASDIAYAVCTEVRPGQAAGCTGAGLPMKASETAYTVCLGYHPGDSERACKQVRGAYEADLRAYLAPQTVARPAAPPKPDMPAPPTGSYKQRYATARAMYVATSRDAQTFEAALLIPTVRSRVTAVIGSLDDTKLRALAAQSKAEAMYWYQYMQNLEQGEAD
jgi:hypothetical protein